MYRHVGTGPARWSFGNESRGWMERIANIRRVEGKTGNVWPSSSSAFAGNGGSVKRQRNGQNRENQNKRMSEKKKESEGEREKYINLRKPTRKGSRGLSRTRENSSVRNGGNERGR